MRFKLVLTSTDERQLVKSFTVVFEAKNWPEASYLAEDMVATMGVKGESVVTYDDKTDAEAAAAALRRAENKQCAAS